MNMVLESQYQYQQRQSGGGGGVLQSQHPQQLQQQQIQTVGKRSRRQQHDQFLIDQYIRIVSTIPFEIQQLIICKAFADFRKFENCITQFKDIFSIYCQPLVWFNIDYHQNTFSDAPWYHVSSNLFEDVQVGEDDYDGSQNMLMFGVKDSTDYAFPIYGNGKGKGKGKGKGIQPHTRSTIAKFDHYKSVMCLANVGLVRKMTVHCSTLDMVEINDLALRSREIKLIELKNVTNLTNKKWINKVTEIESHIYNNPNNLDYFVTKTRVCKSLKKFSLMLWADTNCITTYDSSYFEKIELIKKRGVQVEFSLTSNNLFTNESIFKTLSKVSNNVKLERLDSPFSQNLINNLDKVDEIKFLNFNEGDSLFFLEQINQQTNCKIQELEISANDWIITDIEFMNESIKLLYIDIYELGNCSFKGLKNLEELTFSCIKTDMQTINSLSDSVKHIDFQFRSNSFEGGSFDYGSFRIPLNLEKISLCCKNEVTRSLNGQCFTKEEFEDFRQQKIEVIT